MPKPVRPPPPKPPTLPPRRPAPMPRPGEYATWGCLGGGRCRYATIESVGTPYTRCPLCHGAWGPIIPAAAEPLAQPEQQVASPADPAKG